MSPVELWRERSDSSGRSEPLVMVRVLLAPEGLEAAVALYERLLGVACDLRFAYPEMELYLASVGNVLLIAGRDDALDPFRATAMTLLVASLDDELARFGELGVELLEPPKAVPTGRNMLARHHDGAVVEYVEHRPQPGELGP
jgi:predicted enzyme related to lactoylglutathione lyase